MATPAVVDFLTQLWEVPRLNKNILPQQSDCAIVLGGLSDPLNSTAEHTEWNRSLERLTEAVELYRQGRVKAILITSGSGELLAPEAVEAPALERFALAMGIPQRDLWLESASRNTYENATRSLPILDQHRVKTAVLITSAWHMRRAWSVFTHAGYTSGGRQLTAWPVDTQRLGWPAFYAWVAHPEALVRLQTLIHEGVGWLAYALQGYL